MNQSPDSSETVPYLTAQAFGAALTARLKQLAASSPYNISQLRRHFAYDRLLARIFAEPASRWVLKGGVSMLARISTARHSADVDQQGAPSFTCRRVETGTGWRW